MKKLLIILAFLVLVCLYAISVNADLSQNMVRLHVIANSNSSFDQSLKLKVRDRIISEFSCFSDDFSSKEDAEKEIRKNLDRIKVFAENVIKEEGYDYSVLAEYGRSFFPKKKYGDITLPSGDYDALKIKIGKAEGENWWCVMFPPVCITSDCTAELDKDAMEFLKNHLSPYDFSLITEDSTVFRFQIRIRNLSE